MGFFSRTEVKARQVNHDPNAMIRMASQSIDTSIGNQYRGYMSNPFVYRAVNLTAGAVSSIPVLVYDTKGDEIMRDDHPLIKLLRRPNPKMSWSNLISAVETHLGINGNAYILLVRTSFGVAEMHPVSPGKVNINKSNDFFNPVASYKITTGTGTMVIMPEDMIHLKLNEDEDGMGISPMYVARRAIDMQDAAVKWNTSALTNGAKPSFVLKIKNTLTSRQRKELREETSAKMQGTDNTGQVTILDDQMDMTPVGMSALDMDYANGMIMNSREIAVAYATPSELIGDVSNKTYANAAEAGRQFAINCVVPRLESLYSAIDAVLTPLYKDVGRITYDVAGVQDLAGDQTALYSAITNTDFLTVNEKRELFGYDDIGAEGDIILTGMGKVPLSEAVTAIEIPPMRGRADE